MNRASVVRALAAVVAVSVLAVAAPVRAKHAAKQFNLVETSIPAIHEAIEDGIITAEQLAARLAGTASTRTTRGPIHARRSTRSAARSMTVGPR